MQVPVLASNDHATETLAICRVVSCNSATWSVWSWYASFYVLGGWLLRGRFSTIAYRANLRTKGGIGYACVRRWVLSGAASLCVPTHDRLVLLLYTIYGPWFGCAQRGWCPERKPVVAFWGTHPLGIFTPVQLTRIPCSDRGPSFSPRQ